MFNYHNNKPLEDTSDDELLELVDDQTRSADANVVRELITPAVNAQHQQDATQWSADLLNWQE